MLDPRETAGCLSAAPATSVRFRALAEDPNECVNDDDDRHSGGDRYSGIPKDRLIWQEARWHVRMTSKF
jgi:hypothetical protein